MKWRRPLQGGKYDYIPRAHDKSGSYGKIVGVMIATFLRHSARPVWRWNDKCDAYCGSSKGIAVLCLCQPAMFCIRTQRQRRGFIPAWGNVPGAQSRDALRADGPHQHLANVPFVVKPGESIAPLALGFLNHSAWGVSPGWYRLGRWPTKAQQRPQFFLNGSRGKHTGPNVGLARNARATNFGSAPNCGARLCEPQQRCQSECTQINHGALQIVLCCGSQTRAPIFKLEHYLTFEPLDTP